MSKHMSISSRISLKMLRYFYAVAVEGHFGRAAKNLSITNSPLSAQIKELEALIGSPLFERSTRSVQLSDIGMMLLEECETIFRVVDNSLSNVIQASRTKKNTINIGLISSFFWAGLGNTLSSFASAFPSVRVNIFEMTPQIQKEALLHKTIDIGLMRYADTINIAPLSSTILVQDFMVVVVPSDHRLRHADVVHIHDLAEEQMIVMQRQDTASTKLIIDAFIAQGCHAQITQQVYEPNTLMAIVGSSNLIAIVPASFASQHWENVHFLALSNRLPAHLCAVSKQHNTSIALQHFITHASSELTKSHSNLNKDQHL